LAADGLFVAMGVLCKPAAEPTLKLDVAPRQRLLLFKLFKQSSPRDSQFLRGERKAACRDGADLVCRFFPHGISTLKPFKGQYYV